MPYTATLPEKPTSNEVRSALMGAAHYLHELKSKKTDERGAGWSDDVRSAVTFIMGDPTTGEPGYDSIEAALRTAEIEIEERSAPGAGPKGATLSAPDVEARSCGEVFVESDEYQAFAKAGHANAAFQELNLRGSLLWGTRGRRDAEFRTDDTVTSVATGAGAGGVWRPVGQPADQPPRIRHRRLFIRDLVTVQGTGLSSVPYILESMPATDESHSIVGGANDTGAATTAEGTAKAQVDMAWVQADAPIRKITAWIPATTEIIDDAPTLMGYVDGRLSYLLALREEVQILAGSATAPDLKGILAFSGLQSQAALAYPGATIAGSGSDADPTHIDAMATLGMAISKVETVDGEVDGIAINPINYWTIVTTRRSQQFDGFHGIDAGGYSTPPGDLWGVPTVRTRSVKLNEPLVGSFKLGATLFDRQTTTIRVGNQHSDFFTTNKVAVLAEERIGLAVHRPDFFVTCLLHGPA